MRLCPRSLLLFQKCRASNQWIVQLWKSDGMWENKVFCAFFSAYKCMCRSQRLFCPIFSRKFQAACGMVSPADIASSTNVGFRTKICVKPKSVTGRRALASARSPQDGTTSCASPPIMPWDMVRWARPSSRTSEKRSLRPLHPTSPAPARAPPLSAVPGTNCPTRKLMGICSDSR